MENMDVLSEEIVIVGSRYGELADVVIPLFEKGEPKVHSGTDPNVQFVCTADCNATLRLSKKV